VLFQDRFDKFLRYPEDVFPAVLPAFTRAYVKSELTATATFAGRVHGVVVQ
jgi:hypothetical protein